MAIAAGDTIAGTVRVIDTADGSVVAMFREGEGAIRDVTFNADGDLLASADQDGTVRVWDWRDHKLLATLPGHDDAVFSVEFMPTGTDLVSASGDGTTRIWSCALCTGLDRVIDIASRRLTRELSPAERERYLDPLE